MSRPEKQSPRYQPVTINLMNGETIVGHLLGFSPIMHKLHFIGSGDGASRKLDIADIVFIGMQHTSDAPIKHPARLSDMDDLKISTVNLDTFDVLALPAVSNASGFYAYPKDESSPFDRIFFYQHGLRYQEKPERLGDMLIDQEILGEEDVQKALDFQITSMPSLGNVLKDQGKVSESDLDEALKTQKLQRMRLGDLLVHHEFVTESDVNEALEEQSRSVGTPLGKILMDTGKVQDAHLDSALHMQSRRKMRLGEILLEANLINEADLKNALDEQKAHGHRLGEILLNTEVITEDQLLDVLAKKFRLPTVDLETYEINPAAGTLIERAVVEKYGILPIDTDAHSLTIALSDPMGLEAYDTISFKTGKKVHEVMAKASQLELKIAQFLKEDLADDELSCEFLHQENDEEDEPQSAQEMTQSAEDAPIVRLVNRIIRNGLRKNASDIHILPQAKKITLAYRLNGQLLSENSLDRGSHKQIAARIKILCGMDISEQRLPQDGRLQLRDGKKKYEFRVSCIPNTFGESLVLRVLNKDAAVDLEKLGLRQSDLAQLSIMVRKPYGLLLVTGPTGSGKSTTLFSVLKSISHLPAHILTIEDPVESEIPGANQIQVNSKIGMTFARILRNVLRHDPDIIMIGEMRDAETAEIGIEAALTGHLMFSTLHTNSAVDTIIRLNDLDVPNYLIAPSLLGVISQNLLKTLCPDCRQPVPEDDEVFSIISDLGYPKPEHLYTGAGCKKCNKTGYVGRVMLYEFLAVNDAIRQAIHDGKTGHDLQEIAIANGMVPKSEYALKLAADGVIDHHDFVYSLM
ncbi:type II/IV secretion system protein [Mariprofundus ferrooxydans]|uniref:type II/IV secretion system protein n=1 Tax=Mariprofundus ferrooxydans TaxID=314344 RepID=UPI0003623916|nr:ATPase, T2SS/T4P/T4SS family [Mariprofundus ferrooxydans]